ncbi:MAG: 4-(cytidine 5'-diphospho)-2-C-methyl-D-erythritol kinase [Planctomycetota bacterium]
MIRVTRAGQTVSARSPAKLNLFLEILGKLPNGYHELETLMTTVSIYDTLELAPHDSSDIELEANWGLGYQARSCADLAAGAATVWEALPDSRSNLVYRALDRLRESTGERRGVRASLVKQIPAAAGLGGASGDAAAALLAGNEFWNLGLKSEQLLAIANSLGSDIAFFMTAAATPITSAVCRGRGERVEPIAHLPSIPCVLVRPPAGLATPAVFRICRPSPQPRAVEPLITALQCGDLGAAGRLLHNGLQAAACELSPWVARLAKLLAKYEVAGHQMSGSGTTYFALCYHARQARQLAGRLQQAGVGAVYQAVTAAP